jgi:hypothetical protein
VQQLSCQHKKKKQALERWVWPADVMQQAVAVKATMQKVPLLPKHQRGLYLYQQVVQKKRHQRQVVAQWVLQA